jgi:hypothetical protein
MAGPGSNRRERERSLSHRRLGRASAGDVWTYTHPGQRTRPGSDWPQGHCAISDLAPMWLHGVQRDPIYYSRWDSATRMVRGHSSRRL